MRQSGQLGLTGPLVLVTCVGMAGTIGQILVLREFLVLFYGNELSSGLFFTCWLVWTALGSGAAGFFAQRRRSPDTRLPWVLLTGGLSLPASLLFIRGARLIGSVPSGEMLSLPFMILISCLATLPTCVSLGALFSIAWSGYADRGDASGSMRPIRVYMFEALGAAAGSAIFYVVLLPDVHALAASLGLAALLVGLAVAHLLSELLDGRRAVGRLAACALALLVPLAAALNLIRIEALSRVWQWGDRTVAAWDTPYHHLTVLEESGLFTFFGSGLWLFSAPDRHVAEYASHPALLQHPRPRSVLLIGGGVSGLVDEVLKYPDIATIVVIEPDPELIRLARQLLPSHLTAALDDPRVHVAHEDAGSFLKKKGATYDVVLLNVGEPMNIQMNRFYTVELFRLIKGHLGSDGVFSFALPVAPEMVGPAQARLIGSLNASLRAVFPQVRLVMGGEGARFLAGVREGGLETDAAVLSLRAGAYGLGLEHLNEAALQDLFSPFRALYVEAVLQEGVSLPVNEDFRPVSALQGLLVWTAQIHPGLETWLLRVTSRGAAGLWKAIAVVSAGLALVVLWCRGRWGRGPGVALSVAAAGGALMVLQLCLLFGFQILEGYLYMELALIVGAFMVGIAAGAALLDHLAARIRRPRIFLALAQLGLMAHFAGTILLLLLFHESPTFASRAYLGWLFPALALVAGALGGLHYSLAVQTMNGERTTVASPWVGGGLYALDLLGAAVGAITVSLILLPVYGLITTCLAALAVLGVSLAILVLF